MLKNDCSFCQYREKITFTTQKEEEKEETSEEEEIFFFGENKHKNCSSSDQNSATFDSGDCYNDSNDFFECFDFTFEQRKWWDSYDSSNTLTFAPFLREINLNYPIKNNDSNGKHRIFTFKNLEKKQQLKITETSVSSVVDTWVKKNVLNQKDEDCCWVGVDLEWDCCAQTENVPHLVQVWTEYMIQGSFF